MSDSSIRTAAWVFFLLAFAVLTYFYFGMPGTRAFRFNSPVFASSPEMAAAFRYLDENTKDPNYEVIRQWGPVETTETIKKWQEEGREVDTLGHRSRCKFLRIKIRGINGYGGKSINDGLFWVDGEKVVAAEPWDGVQEFLAPSDRDKLNE